VDLHVDFSPRDEDEEDTSSTKQITELGEKRPKHHVPMEHGEEAINVWRALLIPVSSQLVIAKEVTIIITPNLQ